MSTEVFGHITPSRRHGPRSGAKFAQGLPAFAPKGATSISHSARIGLAIAIVCSSLSRADADPPSLASAAAASGRYFGAAIRSDYLDDKPFAQALGAQFSSVTPENEMKWGVVEPVRGTMNWRGPDAIVAWAKAHGFRLRGHTLVWHSQLPRWLTSGEFSAEEVKALMISHIDAEMSRYKGAVYAWDVVNEVFEADGSWRKSIWYDAMGPDFVRIAFETARKADPAAKLYINDYDIETAGPKMRALLDLVAKLKQAGTPIDGVGLQSHFSVGGVPPDFEATLATFAGLGVNVAVTELDIRIRLPADTTARDRQAADYGRVAAACRANLACVGVTTWGLSDEHSWVPSFFSGFGDALAFDSDYNPKPAVTAIAAAFAGK